MNDFALYFFILFVILCVFIYIIFRNPFKYPYFIYKFDISGKRNINKEDYIDEYLIKYKMTMINSHCDYINSWKMESEKKI